MDLTGTARGGPDERRAELAAERPGLPPRAGPGGGFGGGHPAVLRLAVLHRVAAYGDRGAAGAGEPAGRAAAGQPPAPAGAGMVRREDRDPVPAAAGRGRQGGLRGQLRYCRWLLADPATWRDLLWMLADGPAGVALGLAPAVFTFIGGWVLGSDLGTLAFGWWNTAPPTPRDQVLFLSMLPVGVAGLIAGPKLLRAHAQIASVLLAPTRAEMATQLGRLTETRAEVVDASAAELRRIERDLHDGAQARLVALGMSIGLAEQLLRDHPDEAVRCWPRPGSRADRRWPSCAPGPRHPAAGAGRARPGRRDASAGAALPLPVEVQARPAEAGCPRRSSRRPTSPSPRRWRTWSSTAARPAPGSRWPRRTAGCGDRR